MAYPAIAIIFWLFIEIQSVNLSERIRMDIAREFNAERSWFAPNVISQVFFVNRRIVKRIIPQRYSQCRTEYPNVIMLPTVEYGDEWWLGFGAMSNLDFFLFKEIIAFLYFSQGIQ